MAGLGRIQEVSSSFGPIGGACVACLKITMAGSCSGPSSCSLHHFPLSLSSSLTFYQSLSSFSLPIPLEATMQVWISPVFFGFPVPIAYPPWWVLTLLNGSAVSLSHRAALHETELCPSTAIPQLSPSSSLLISGSLLQIRTTGFPPYPPADSLSPSHWKRHCKYTFLSIVLCLI